MWQLPVLCEEVDDVEGVSVTHADGQVKHRLSRFLPQTDLSTNCTRSEGDQLNKLNFFNTRITFHFMLAS